MSEYEKVVGRLFVGETVRTRWFGVVCPVDADVTRMQVDGKVGKVAYSVIPHGSPAVSIITQDLLTARFYDKSGLRVLVERWVGLSGYVEGVLTELGADADAWVRIMLDVDEDEEYR